MKMPDGGFAPAGSTSSWASDTGSRAIVGVDVTQAGSDKGQAEPMRRQVEDRTGSKFKST